MVFVKQRFVTSLGVLLCFPWISCNNGALSNKNNTVMAMKNVSKQNETFATARNSTRLNSISSGSGKSSPDFINDFCGLEKDEVCLQAGECLHRGGTPGLACNDGLGECCTFVGKCDEFNSEIEVNELVTKLETPSIYSLPSCTFRFKKEPNICQIRLDFVDVRLSEADPEGFCSNDKLVISGSATVQDGFTVCGYSYRRHMYLAFGSKDCGIEVSPLLKDSSSTYNIVARKISCDSNDKAPDHCLQYFTDSSGVVDSFGMPSQQQNNQQYTTCVKPLPQSKAIEWRPCNVPSPHNGLDIISQYTSSVYGACTDWIQIPGESKICSSFTSIRSTWKPYNLLVNFDQEELAPVLPALDIPCDPSNCASTCPPAPPGLAASVLCQCIGIAPTQTCQCTIDATSYLGQAIAPIQSDFNNKGFCLEYTQF